MSTAQPKKPDTLNNAASALSLLKEWLSISESQICSTEVLSEQLPRINKLLEDSMNEISGNFSIVAENTRKIATEIEAADRHLDIIKIRNKEIEITKHLQEIAKESKDKETAKKLLSLAKKINEQEEQIHSELKQALLIVKDNSNKISNIVVGMQFQDRVSQNIVITVNILKTIVEYLDKEIGDALPNISREERRKLLDRDFALQILDKLRLGELQLSFVNHLIDHGYIKDAAEVGFSIEAHQKNDDSDDDIDLF